LAGAKKTFSSTLNVMILQMVRNESVRSGRHIDIEVSYKILQLEIVKLVLILYYLACFQKGCLEAILSKNTLGPLGIKYFIQSVCQSLSAKVATHSNGFDFTKSIYILILEINILEIILNII
jgi:hypothetical protein